jgi:hypothetical protein
LALEEALDYLIEIKTRWAKSRGENLQDKSDAIKSALGDRGLRKLGVWIEMPPAAWSQDL